jgi:hypothetical protein
LKWSSSIDEDAFRQHDISEEEGIMVHIILGLFVLVLGLNLGAGLYEGRIVVPLWAGGIPETLEEGNPYGRVAVNAGIHFWAYMTSAAGIFALLALATGFWAPAPQRAWQIVGAFAELVSVAMTLLYFRPTVVRLFMGHGAGLSVGQIASTVHRWVAWNRVRLVVTVVAWLSALYALYLC